MARKKSDETPTESSSAGVDGGEVSSDEQPTATMDTTKADSTQPVVAEPSGSSDAPTDSVSDSPNSSEGPPTEPQTWMVRPWQAVAALIAAVLLAGGIGSAIGAASKNGEIDDLRSKRQTLLATRDRLEGRVRGLEDRVNDREAQQRADEAAAERIAAEQEQKEREAAELAAQQAAEAAAAAAAADAAANSFSDGIFEVGVDKSPGRYKTDGGSSCYWAVLNSPDTGDIATNNFGAGPQTADLSPGKFFESQDCGTWTRVG